MASGCSDESLDSLKQRLADAKLRLVFARNFSGEILRDFQSGSISAPTEMFACTQAIRAERFALREYDRLLRILANRVLNGNTQAASS